MRRRQPRGEVLIVIPVVMLIALVFEQGVLKEGREQKSQLRFRDLLLKSLTLDGEFGFCETGRLSTPYNSWKYGYCFIVVYGFYFKRFFIFVFEIYYWRVNTVSVSWKELTRFHVNYVLLLDNFLMRRYNRLIIQACHFIHIYILWVIN